jgi:hypothetical protein
LSGGGGRRRQLIVRRISAGEFGLMLVDPLNQVFIVSVEPGILRKAPARLQYDFNRLLEHLHGLIAVASDECLLACKITLLRLSNQFADAGGSGLMLCLGESVKRGKASDHQSRNQKHNNTATDPLR